MCSSTLCHGKRKNAFHSQIIYEMQRNIVKVLAQLKSKEEETQEKLSKTNCSNYVLFILFSLSWKFWPQLAREYASFF